MKLIITCLFGLAATTRAFSGNRQLLQSASFVWPLYDQSCADDAGPPFVDDEETFGPGVKYHSNSKAQAVLQDGSCPGPLQEACAARSNGGELTDEVTRAAYLEGPLQCGGRGWFCRILPDRSHDGGRKLDWNYNHCNRTEYGDSDGHCHGSDNDDVYYWWVRDHWHRNYAGRLHCCCDWGAVQDVVARCDFRASLGPGENVNCRDANEDHNGPGSGSLFAHEAGCSNLGTTDPLPEPPEGQCWDVLKFAPGYEDGDGGEENDKDSWEEDDDKNSWEEDDDKNSWEEDDKNSWEEDGKDSWEEDDKNSWEEDDDKNSWEEDDDKNSWEEDDDKNSWEEDDKNSWEEDDDKNSWWKEEKDKNSWWKEEKDKNSWWKEEKDQNSWWG